MGNSPSEMVDRTPTKIRRKKVVKRLEKPDKPALEAETPPSKDVDGSDPWQYGKSLLKENETAKE